MGQPLVVGSHPPAQLRKYTSLIIRKRILGLEIFGHGFLNRTIPGLPVPNHPQLLSAEAAAFDLERVSSDDVLIRRDAARYHHLTESPARIDDDFISPGIHWVTDKHHTSNVRFNHRLDHNRDKSSTVVESPVMTIRSNPRSPH